MSTANEGRNEIRFNNSGGKCLLENWVEERAVEPIDSHSASRAVSGKTETCSDTSSAQKYREGHTGILTTNTNAGANKSTTTNKSYSVPEGPNMRVRGKKAELLEQMLFEQVSKEVYDEWNPPPEQADYMSVTMKDFSKEFVSQKPKPTAVHDFKKDQPVTFWTEHKDRITGVTQVKTGDSSFRRNDAFSKPIDEYWDETQPYDLENFPKM